MSHVIKIFTKVYFVMTIIYTTFKHKLIIVTEVIHIYILQGFLLKYEILKWVVSNYSHYLVFLWEYGIENLQRHVRLIYIKSQKVSASKYVWSKICSASKKLWSKFGNKYSIIFLQQNAVIIDWH